MNVCLFLCVFCVFVAFYIHAVFLYWFCISGGCLLCMLCFLHELFPLIYIKGRFIGFNIRQIQDVIDYANELDSEGAILFLDFRKAFDTVEF